MPSTRRSLLAGIAAGTAGVTGCIAPTQRDGQADYTGIYSSVVDSVVEVHVTDGQQPRGQGSGFVVGDGVIVTNHHVVDVGPDISVQFSTREWTDASVLGSDPHSDLAVLSVESANVPDPLQFVAESPPVGEEVLAIGSPFDLSDSLSRGIISGRNRSIPGPGRYQVADTVQTDAALNPGSSGGPLVDLDGRVVGVVMANQGGTVGFAVSAALAKRVVPALEATGSYDHSRLGVTIQEVGPALAEANGLDEPGGLLVVQVLADGPADGVLEPSIELDDNTSQTTDTGPDNESSGGEQPPDGVQINQGAPTGGDVIVGLAGEPIPNGDRLATVLALETSPGETVPVTVVRDGEERTVEVTLGSRSAE